MQACPAVWLIDVMHIDILKLPWRKTDIRKYAETIQTTNTGPRSPEYGDRVLWKENILVRSVGFPAMSDPYIHHQA